MNKIKLLLLLLMAATGMAAFADDASFEFVESDGGKTLTIKGYGDMTNYSQTSTETKIVFSNAASGNIYTDTDNNGTSVTPQDTYNTSATYYYKYNHVETTYTPVFDGGKPTGSQYTYPVSTSTVWNEAAVTADDTYIYPAYMDYRGKIKVDEDGKGRVTSGPRPDWIGTFSYNGQTYVNFVKLSHEANKGEEMDPDESFLLTQAQLENYFSTTTTYTVVTDNLYRSLDNGTTKELLVNNQTYTYNAGDLFYTAETESFSKYEEIENNEEFFATNSTYLEIEYKETTTTFKDALLAKIKSGAYTKVVFDNTGSDELLIDPAISLAILFPYIQAGSNSYYSTNTNIETLDMGEATLKLSEGQSYSNIITNPDNVDYLSNLTNFTIPMMPKDENGKMVLPSEALKGKFPGNCNLKTLTIPAGYTELDDESISTNAGITTVNLPEGLKEIGDDAFHDCTALKNINITGAPVEGRSIVLPSKLETIGKSAFENCGSLTSTAEDPFILPSGLKTVKASAFINLTNLKFLQLNEGLEYVGNTAFGLDHEVHDQTTITFPSTIKYLGPGSFISRWYQDLYFTGKTAPVCPVGKPAFGDWGNVTAFSANTQMGNNGFNPNKTEGSTADNAQQGYANRENYINNGYYFTILHFPAGLTSDQAKTYRDITRRYVTAKGNEWDHTGNTFYYGGNIANFVDPVTKATFGSAFKESADGEKSSLVYYMSGKDAPLYSYTYSGNVQPGFVDTYLGEQQIWPSQSQWERNFITVANGVEWDGVTVYRPTLTEEMFNMMKEDALFVQANSLDYSTNRVADANNSHGYGKELKLAEKTWGELTNEEKDYLSLILYQGTRRFVLGNDSPYKIPFILELETGRWWSICLPFNMTKAQVDKVFGKGTHVCLFSGVDRTNDAAGKVLRLKFTNDVYHHKTERTVQNNGSSIIYTYGANYSKANAEPADNDIVIYARESYMIYPMAEDEDASSVAVRNFGIPEFTVGDPLPTMIQANSETPYTIDGKDVAYRHIGNFNTTASYDKDGNSVPVKIPRYSYAYGKSGGVVKFFILDSDMFAWTPFKSIVQNLGRDGGLDDWNNYFLKASANVKQLSVFGLEEDITGVENVIIEASSDNDADKVVYNINGTQAGDSLEGLAPGVYVQQGKAYIVK